MSGIRKNIWKHLKDRVFRQSYVEEHVRAGVAHQIKSMREVRGWSQAQLAEKCGKSQSNIARIEDPDYGKFSVQTLLEIAHSFDVWLSLEFVSFSSGLARTADRSAQALNALSFDEELSLSVKHSMANRAGNPGAASALRSYKSSPRQDSLNLVSDRNLAATPNFKNSISGLCPTQFEHVVKWS